MRSHLGLREDRLGERQPEQVQGLLETALRHVEVDAQPGLVDRGAERDPLALQQLGELLRRVLGSALVEQAGHHRGDALHLTGLGRQRQRQRRAHRDDVLAGDVVGHHLDPVGQCAPGRDGKLHGPGGVTSGRGAPA